MASYIEALHLDFQAAKNLADAHHGYATYLITTEDELNNDYIASSFLIAAVLSMLIDSKNSQYDFQQSAEYYLDDKNPYWKIVAICGYDIRRLYEFGEEKQSYIEATPNYQFAEMLRQQFIATEDSRNIRPDLIIKPNYLAVPVGRLGIPISVYLSAFREVAELHEGFTQREKALIELVFFLNRASEGIRLQQNDTYHWEKLKGSIIPVEPEVIAACIILIKSAKSKNLNLNFLVDELQVDNIAKIPLLIAKDIVESQHK